MNLPKLRVLADAAKARMRSDQGAARAERSVKVSDKRPTPYQRIIAAAKLGKGVVLSADDVARMAVDSAVIELASNDDEDDGE